MHTFSSCFFSLSRNVVLNSLDTECVEFCVENSSCTPPISQDASSQNQLNQVVQSWAQTVLSRLSRPTEILKGCPTKRRTESKKRRLRLSSASLGHQCVLCVYRYGLYARDPTFRKYTFNFL